jgi:hypothetical protein
MRIFQKTHLLRGAYRKRAARSVPTIEISRSVLLSKCTFAPIKAVTMMSNTIKIPLITALTPKDIGFPSS